MDENTLKQLTDFARNVRMNVVKSITAAGSGHTGGSMGLADVFSLLYQQVLKHRPSEPDWSERDRLVLSIGHVAPVLYAALAQSGYFEVSELLTLRKLGSRLQGHPGRDFGLPGIELSAGSLGQGLSVATGMALSAKLASKTNRIYCLMGDGELQEGSVWEAAMSAAHYKLNNLVAVVDRNGLQIDGKTSDVMELEPLADKWKAFGWNVIACDGHDFTDLEAAFEAAAKCMFGPTVIIAHTIMGKGIPEIEGDYGWHGKAPDAEQCERFLNQINKS